CLSLHAALPICKELGETARRQDDARGAKRGPFAGFHVKTDGAHRPPVVHQELDHGHIAEPPHVVQALQLSLQSRGQMRLCPMPRPMSTRVALMPMRCVACSFLIRRLYPKMTEKTMLFW